MPVSVRFGAPRIARTVADQRDDGDERPGAREPEREAAREAPEPPARERDLGPQQRRDRRAERREAEVRVVERGEARCEPQRPCRAPMAGDGGPPTSAVKPARDEPGDEERAGGAHRHLLVDRYRVVEVARAGEVRERHDR
jgi:hypothetical protein